MGKYYSDLERYEYVRKFRISGKTIRQYAREEGVNERTLGDWIRAYNNRYTSKLFSIIQTCKINNINVEKYLEYVLNNINKVNISDLTPYSKHIGEIKK